MARREIIQKMIEDHKVGLFLAGVGGILVPQAEIDQRLGKIEHLKKLLAMPEIDKDMETLNGLLDHIGRQIIIVKAKEIALAAEKKALQAQGSLIEEIMAIPL